MVARRLGVNEILLAPDVMMVEGERATSLRDMSPLDMVTDLGHIAFTASVAWRRESVPEVKVPAFVKGTIDLPELVFLDVAMLDSSTRRPQASSMTMASGLTP